MKVRGLRGAITVFDNTEESICSATQKLLCEMIKQNDVQIDDICFIMFSVTSDLNATFPAKAARRMGLDMVPLLDVAQLDVEGDLNRCVRILMVFNTDKKLQEIKHVYLGDAARLRPDLTR